MFSRLSSKTLTSSYSARSVYFRRAVLTQALERSALRHSLTRSASMSSTIVQLRGYNADNNKPEDKIPKGFEQFFDKEPPKVSQKESKRLSSKDDPNKPAGSPRPPSTGLSTWLSVLLFTSLLWALTLPSDTGKETTWQDFRTLLLGITAILKR